jgi:hypothetical protein
MKFLIFSLVAISLSACGTSQYQGKGPAGSDRADYSNSNLDCTKIARSMNGRMDQSTTYGACKQDDSRTPAGG